MYLNRYPKYTIYLLQTTCDECPQIGASQYATQQARPRLVSRYPTFFVIWIETQGDRVYAVAFVGYTYDRCQCLSSETKGG